MKFRELQAVERFYVYGAPRYRCCFCGHEGLTDGPRGGASMNMGCPSCGAVLNLIPPEYKTRYGEHVQFFGQVVQEPTKPYRQVTLSADPSKK